MAIWKMAFPLLMGLTMMNITVDDAHGDEKPESTTIRSSVLAGSWYDRDRDKLETRLSGYLDRVDGQIPEGAAAVAALIAPHAGYDYSGPCAAHAYKAVAGGSFRRVILIGPSHRAYFKGLAIPEEDYFETPFGLVAVDRAACRSLAQHEQFSILKQAHAQEHSLEIQLPFLQHVLEPGFELVPLVAGEIKRDEYAAIAEALRPLAGPGTLLVASSDFTHYGTDFGYLPFSDNVKENLAILDGGALEKITALDFNGFLDYKDRTGATICGFRPIGLLIKYFTGSPQSPSVSVRQLDYTTSGHLSGDWRHTVSYAALAFVREGVGDQEKPAGAAPQAAEPAENVDSSRTSSEQEAAPASAVGAAQEPTADTQSASDEEEKVKQHKDAGLNSEEQTFLLRLARETIQRFVETGELPPVPPADRLTPIMYEHRGAFVTLHEQGRLRGCIGYIQGVKPLWETIIDNAISAATRDPRFPKVNPAEVPDLHLEISVLTPLVKNNDLDTIQVGTHGLYIVKGFSSGLLLPQVATEQGWDRQTFLEHVCLKAGLERTAYRQGAEIYTFAAQVFAEEE